MPWGQRYELLLTTETPTGEPAGPTSYLPGAVELPARAVWLLRVLRRV
jgi:glycogen operon protein